MQNFSNNKVPIIEIDSDRHAIDDIRLQEEFEWRWCRTQCDPRLKIHQFRLEKTVGEGAFGRIVLATFKGEGHKKIALKILNKRKLVEIGNLEKVLSELRITASCNHPNIVRFDFAFMDNSYIYIGLEYLKYGNLMSEMQRKRFSEASVKFVIAQFVLALEYLHAMGIVHRDIKPENTLLTKDGYIKLCDFGLGRRTGLNCFTFCGTMFYMAPEIFQSIGYGKMVDWWAIGVLIYEMMTGNVPFSGRNTNAIAKSINKANLKIPKRYSPELREFNIGLLRKEPIRRLGCNGSKEIKSSKWFKDISFMDVFSHKIPSNIVPTRIARGPVLKETPIHIEKESYRPELFVDF
ncbi:hypothetical protein ACOME3_006128 [Neoechinorhynchus agilis]